MNFDQYKNTMPYPRRHDFNTTYWYKGGKLVAIQGAGQPPVEPGFDFASCVREDVFNKDAFDKARDMHHAVEQRVYEQFKADLFNDLGIANHPMREKLFSMAWEDGHGAGYSEVYDCALGLVDLIQVPAGYMLVRIDSDKV